MKPLWTGAWLACAALALATGCNREKGSGEEVTAAVADAQAAGLVEERDEGKLEWIVQADGAVLVKVTVGDGATAPALAGSIMLDGQSFPLTAEGSSLSATIPALSAELTTIAYSLKVGEGTWDGALHVPLGGTKDLIEAPAVTVAEGTKGPHGGAVEVVGDQRVEMVVDEASGEVRVYLLDEKLQPIPVGEASAVAGFAQ